MAKSVLIQIREFFGMKSSEFMQQWQALSDKDKDDLKAGVENGTLTY